jgi:TetR/AcrR family transcriptional repressor of mexJK operon
MTRQQIFETRREEIIDAALRVFSEKGFNAATNKDIAKAAGIRSPGLIYHYFEDKRALFETVLRERMPAVQTVLRDQALLSEPVPVVLQRVGLALLETASQPGTTALLRLLLGEAIRQQEVAEMFYQTGSTHILGFLYRYFGRLMAQEVIRQADPGAVVRCFIGPFLMTIFFDILFDLPDEQAPDHEALVETAVSIFLTGMDYRQL